jgi:hypothetical protein
MRLTAISSPPTPPTPWYCGEIRDRDAGSGFVGLKSVASGFFAATNINNGNKVQAHGPRARREIGRSSPGKIGRTA